MDSVADKCYLILGEQLNARQKMLLEFEAKKDYAGAAEADNGVKDIHDLSHHLYTNIELVEELSLIHI